MEDINQQMGDRLRKMESLREAGVNPFANGFTPTATCAQVLERAAETEPPDMNELADDAPAFAVAGRVMARNHMGKAMFLRIRDRSVGVSQDGPQALQLYIRREVVGDAIFQVFRQLDLGDIVGIEGALFRTRTGEPTLMVRGGRLLTKSLRPLPEKFHGLTDVETRLRQRYVDLIVNPAVREVFHARSLITGFIRRFLAEREFVEVETPMMHPIPGGAVARPFETFHNALGIPLFLRIAPELYLKRLVVGGMERVFEVNRNFRNEGLSPRHNPEFTMLEFYQAYATYEDLIALTEQMLAALVLELNGDGSTTRPFGERVIDWKSPFARMTVRESLVEVAGLAPELVADADAFIEHLRDKGLIEGAAPPYGKALMLAFDAWVEPKLVQPTFITQFPIEVSPLARRNEEDPGYADRFELFVAGTEIANAFSELNDPLDQRARFEAQVAERAGGDNEAMFMDLDYIRALEYGMPPTAGEGVGIDRLVMLMTDQQTIREVILFPHMRPE
ncbi:MAG: lysine--tRNA ligase [Deltaproteobacteria bacterium]|nr:lysine--tRNA ligase [Deltaproteobacteria bacterium]MCB9785977.1 lysine--tRNA ligase [Deltaproteobacteria bacterium]